ncbi:MAG: hypothetical protein HOC71_18630, partial [Candidatus Latescibacteria bacterium]|nr:hypothetical protein [Candidatus Latescibacterota bacterium]
MWLTAFLEWLLTISNIAVPIFTNLMVQSTILSLMGLYAAYTFRNKSAIFQSLILRAFLAAALICPLISVIIDATGMTGIIFDIPLASSSQTEPQSFYGNAKYGTITPKSSVPRGESNLPEDTFQTSIERVYAGSQEQSM